MVNLTCRMKQHIQPFERMLALKELRALSGSDVLPIDGDDATALTFATTTSCTAERLRDALAYWQFVGDDDAGLTSQIRMEATSLIARNGASPRQLAETGHSYMPRTLPKKRCLRYGTHGLHEYRGKFFPQLVRALLNVADVPTGGVVLDPMCGSGTTLVEARCSGMRGYGIDMNPLSVFVSDAKCEALALAPVSLARAYDRLRTELRDPAANRAAARQKSCDAGDREYLERWFDHGILRELNRVAGVIDRLPDDSIRKFYRVCLSNILRGVSWQKTDDLRVRRDCPDIAPGETTIRFLKEALRSTRTVVAFLAERGFVEGPRHVVVRGDARAAGAAVPDVAGQVDVVVTSPPYATALPYIDTDRLSLIFLGLLRRTEHRGLDTSMIGNREITTRRREEYWEYYRDHNDLLPDATRSMIDRVDRLNRRVAVGFRRRNVAALLSRYFFDMRKALREMHALLKCGASAFLVIGNNRTTAGGVAVEINTADHLAQIGVDVGFNLEDDLSMDMLVSRDIFKNNAVRSERIVRLSKGQ